MNMCVLEKRYKYCNFGSILLKFGIWIRFYRSMTHSLTRKINRHFFKKQFLVEDVFSVDGTIFYNCSFK